MRKIGEPRKDAKIHSRRGPFSECNKAGELRFARAGEIPTCSKCVAKLERRRLKAEGARMPLLNPRRAA